MKKLIVMAFALMVSTTMIFAQEGYDDTKNEIAVSYGFISNSQWLDVFEDVIGAMVGRKTDNEKFTGPISIEYLYRVKNWLGVGCVFVYGQNTQDIMNSENNKTGDMKNAYYTLMPAAKFDWLRKQNFGMYSKLALGATLRNQSIDDNGSNEKNADESAVHFNWQASLLGFEAGSPKVRGFVELGFGEQGIALIGMRCKF